MNQPHSRCLKLGLIASFLFFPVLAGAQTSRTIWDGVFTEDQAARGKAAYETSCVTCHKADLTGITDALKGEQFFDKRREDNLESFYLDLKRMPLRAPGSLPNTTYVDIMAYVLRENAFPSGNSELTQTALPQVQVVGKNGPAPVPGTFPVLIVGCLRMGPNDSWQAVNATEPIRTRRPFDRVETEVAAAKDTPLGTQTFRLQDVEFQNPQRINGHRIVAKGTLVRAPAGNRIIVGSLASVDESCAP